MEKAAIPVYDLRSIDEGARHGLMVAPFGQYLGRHYEHLHHPHRHSFYHLVFFTKGQGTHTIDFEKFEVAPGQVYFMIPGQVHSWQFSGTVDGFIVHFNESFFSSFLQQAHYLEKFSFFNGRPQQSVCRLDAQGLGAAKSLLREMLQEAGGWDHWSPDAVRVLLLQFFMLVERCCAGTGEKAVPQKSLLLRQFQRLIEQHYKEWRLPRQYADLLYVTPNHLNALCRDLLGKTAGDVIRERVLLEAKRLLTGADVPVAAVADELRFGDPSYFNRFFKKYEGCTPDEFRKIQLSL
jgi:AraC family transcriptional activator of pobA